jgi:uncharacterized protein YcsI (UPF0317 family)
MNHHAMAPKELRQQIRRGEWTTATSGACPGRVQANLVMVPAEAAFDFLLFCVRNPKPCPVLDVLEAGATEPRIARGADLRTDLPRYRIFQKGRLVQEVENVTDYFRADMVSFLLGCSFTFENAMLAAGLPVRNIQEGKNVSMYITNIDCIPAGPFSSKMVTSMRPLKPAEALRAVQVTTRFHMTHGAPIHLGDPQAIGIRHLDQPDFGDPVTLEADEIPVFWACGVTSQLAATSTDLPLVITHAPGHMFVSDLGDADLAAF